MVTPRPPRYINFKVMLAVDYLHSVGVAHRDIRLENVVVSEDGQRIKLTDFSLASRLEEGGADPKQKLKSWGAASKRSPQRVQEAAAAGAAFGSPNYAAPEAIDSPDEQR